MKKFEDVTIEKAFYVEVYDYKTNRTFRSMDSFNSYEDAENYIKTTDFYSGFGNGALGIYIVELPKIDINPDSLNECK